MTNKVTLGEAEQLVTQLSPHEQLKLVAWISERLSGLLRLPLGAQQYAAQVEAFLRLSEELAAETVGEVDSAEDIRQIREERASRL